MNNPALIIFLPDLTISVTRPLVAWGATFVRIAASYSRHFLAVPDLLYAAAIQVVVFIRLPDMIAPAETSVRTDHKSIS